MFCQKCGEEINDDAVVCVKCGCSIEKNKPNTPPTQPPEIDEEKTGVGIAMGLFLGVIGLIIGICLYKEGTIARKSFLKAWAISFVIMAIVAVVAYIIYVNVMVDTINSAMDSLYDFNY